MATIGDLINRAARSIGYLGRGQTLTGPEGADALEVANELMAAWNRDGLMFYRTTRDVFTWPAATQSRTIASGAQLNIGQPNKIDGAGYMNGTQEVPITVVEHWEQYKAIPIKTQQSRFPILLYYDQVRSPGVVYLYYVPSSSISLVLYTKAQMPSFTGLSTSFSATLLPDGYFRAYRLELARELAIEWGVAVPDKLDNAIAEAKGAIRSLNILPSIIKPDYAAANDGGDYDINSDGYLEGMH